MNKLYFLLLFFCLALGVNAQSRGADGAFPADEVASKVIKFYPNPASSVINFEFVKPIQHDYTLQIFNFVGKKVFETFTLSQKTAIPLTDFYRGVYIFQLRDKSGRIVESGKFQVSK